MANMSYCRFENTASDLEDCLEALDDMTWEGFSELSRTEKRSAESMYELCQSYMSAFERLEDESSEND